MSEETAVKRTLDRYYTAFSRLDMSAVLQYFSEPALFIGPAGVFSLATSQAVATAFAPVMDSLRARGYSRSELKVRNIELLGSSSASVTGVAIRYAGERELEQVGITYVLNRTEAAWKIAVMVLHDSPGA